MSRASPPAAGTVQMSPPDTNAISRRSGDRAGSENADLTGAGGRDERSATGRAAIMLSAVATRTPAVAEKFTGGLGDGAIRPDARNAGSLTDLVQTPVHYHGGV